jgi:GntR family transcriptional regulator
MILRIDTTSSVPVYEQIVEQVKRAVATGAIKPGDALPSLRETARTLRINPLTVIKAYKLLEQERIIETRHGLGSCVSESALSAAPEYKERTLSRGVDKVLLDAMQLGVSFADVRAIVEERMHVIDNETSGGTGDAQ